MKIEILTRTKCKTCNGSGMVTHPLWDEFDKADEEYKKQHGWYMSKQEMHDWWANQGFYIEQIPPTEINCPRCKGDGYIQEWRDITDLIKK